MSHAEAITIPIDRYHYYPVLDYLPMKETERRIMALVLTFRKKGLSLSNDKIGLVLKRKTATIANTLVMLRKYDLIRTEKAQSRYRLIYPANGESYFTLQEGKVDTELLYLFRNLLYCQESKLLYLPGSEHNKVSKLKEEKTDSPFPHVDPGETPSEAEPTEETLDPERERRVLADLGFITPATEAV